MRAILLGEPKDGLGSLSLVDAERPAPGAHDVLVEVAYGGCNYADTMMREGTYPHPKGYPLVAGLEVSGRVAAVGAHVTAFRPGERVAAFIEGAGGFADFALAPAERCIPLPDAMAFDTGAAFVIQGLTAWHLLHTVSRTRPGDVVLIHAVGGGVGLYLTQLAVAAGARVIGTVGTPGKEERPLRYGAERVVNRAQENFVDAVRDHLRGGDVDKVLDSTGATILDRSFALMRRLGHVVSYGEAEGRPLPNLWERLVERSLTFTRFHLGHSDFASDAWRTAWQEVTGAIVAGRLETPIAQRFALEDVGAMYDRLRSRAVSGKLVLEINPEL